MLRHKAISPSFASLNSKRYIARAVAWRTPNLACLLETGDVVECPCEPWAAEAVQNWTTFTSLDDIALKSVADGFLAQLVTLSAPSCRKGSPRDNSSFDALLFQRLYAQNSTVPSCAGGT